MLGFSFDRVNCHRLGLSRVVAGRSRGSLVPKIYATRFGLTNMEAEFARRRVLEDSATVDAGWQMLDKDSLSSLREWGVLLSAGTPRAAPSRAVGDPVSDQAQNVPSSVPT